VKFKKLDIVFKSEKIQSKNILAVYEYRGYLIVNNPTLKGEASKE
jgi:hypothetical protein